MLMGLGPCVAVSSSNWLIAWVGIELSFLGLMPLLVSGEGKGVPTLSSESALKYFCVQAAGSGLLMCGGVMKFMMPSLMGDFITNIIFLSGLMLKLGIFPFHFWVPSVVAGLGWYSMFLVLTWQKIAPFMFMMNLLASVPSFSSIVLMLGGVSAIVGAMIGLNQTKIAPVLGASSITHSGWVAAGAACGGFWVYFSIYCFSLVFLLFFLSKNQEFMSGVVMLSLSGLPPFVMFLGKWSVLKCALSLSEYWWFISLPLFGSVMSLFFYLKFFYSFYLESENSSTVKLSFLTCFSMLGLFGTLFMISF
uniref:NADH-ubiquinone oxidoreductase chain 2 n=1 Tax=Sakuraeolis japonica TaxID=1939669 RepID=A0A343AZH4_9GAST|nr:NADH dehydrogenase subunit 2 [Sakuraeolis japonica]APZ75723.1 NADH dehydrogenase subunit 2 [Sakuraeolis japonica]